MWRVNSEIEEGLTVIALTNSPSQLTDSHSAEKCLNCLRIESPLTESIRGTCFIALNIYKRLLFFVNLEIHKDCLMLDFDQNMLMCVFALLIVFQVFLLTACTQVCA